MLLKKLLFLWVIVFCYPTNYAYSMNRQDPKSIISPKVIILTTYGIKTIPNATYFIIHTLDGCTKYLSSSYEANKCHLKFEDHGKEVKIAYYNQNDIIIAILSYPALNSMTPNDLYHHATLRLPKDKEPDIYSDIYDDEYVGDGIDLEDCSCTLF